MTAHMTVRQIHYGLIFERKSQCRYFITNRIQEKEKGQKKIMATITLYKDKLNGVGSLISTMVSSVNNLDMQLGVLKSTL